MWLGPSKKCSYCGKKFVQTTDGRGRATCDCGGRCLCWGKITWHEPGDWEKDPLVSGWFCDKCGPFVLHKELKDG